MKTDLRDMNQADLCDMKSSGPISTGCLIEWLRQPCAYPHATEGGVQIYETHISVVMLAGEFAYKIKKPIKTGFLDYSTLERRRSDCEKEVQLDGRYANDLYLGVVPIGWDDGRLKVDVATEPVEYAVKMRRFASGALLSERIDAGNVTVADIHRLAETVASFHREAATCDPTFAAEWPSYLKENFQQVVTEIQSHMECEAGAELRVLRHWVEKFFEEHAPEIELRVGGGLIRECHGDLHAQNVVEWGGRFVPFDGIEFSERLRWIDVLCDAAFLCMDLAYRGRLDLARSFINAYLERTGDYGSLVLLRLFLVYRALVRALVATMRLTQSQHKASEHGLAISDAQSHLDLAYRFTLKEEPKLWITHGFSGSGKTTQSELIVQQRDVIRLRSDVERKRMFGLTPTERPTSELQLLMYSQESNDKTYSRLQDLAGVILRSGYGVIIDATFLRRSERDRFRDLADRYGVPLAILDCQVDEATLRKRITDRFEANCDASDADLSVIEHQFATHQPLTETELGLAVRITIESELRVRPRA